jgi:hypothetical protein
MLGLTKHADIMVNADAKIVSEQLLVALNSIEGNHKDASSQQTRHQTV